MTGPIRWFVWSLIPGLFIASAPSSEAARQKTKPVPSLAPALVWPAPPQPARIAFVQNIRQPSDVGIKGSAFRRFGNWLTGAEKGNEQLVKPFGIALDENENLCLTDTGANAVVYFDRKRKKWKRWDKLEKLTFNSPVAVAKRNDKFFVADSGSGKIITFNEKGKLLFTISEQLERPCGLAIVREELFVVDSQRHRIVVFDLNGRYRRDFGGRGARDGEFNFPTHINNDAAGHLHVTDSMNSRVQVFRPDGAFVAKFGRMGNSTGQFSRPKGVAADKEGNAYVIDALFDNVQIFDRNGRFLLNFGGSGTGSGEFWLPNGIAISSVNEIFVTDSYNRRVQVFKFVGGKQ